MRHGHSLRKSEAAVVGPCVRFMSRDDPKGRDDNPSRRQRAVPSEREDLPYKVELWNEAKTAIEQVLAVTSSASIGHAAFYAAAREHPERYITLRHKQAVINRWNVPSH